MLCPGGEPPVSGRPAVPLEGLGVSGQGSRLNKDVAGSPNLDRYIYITPSQQNEPELPCKESGVRKRQKGRYYNALCSGMTWHKDDDLRFLTLTSPMGARDISVSWNQFVTELRRLTPEYLYKNGFLTSWNLSRFYKGRDLKKKIKFEYLAMKTSEGNGVLHVVTAGDFVPVSWIRPAWKRIHSVGTTWNAGIALNIKLIPKNASNEALRAYMMKQYLVGQDAYVRHDCSAGWLWRGYRKVWLRMVRVLGYQVAIEQWCACLAVHRVPELLPYIERNTPWRDNSYLGGLSGRGYV